MKKLAGHIGALAMLVVLAPLAHANYVLSYSTDGGATVHLCPGEPAGGFASDTLATCFASPTVVAAGVTITTFQGTSNSPGGPAISMQTGSVTTIDASVAGTLILYLAAQNFSFPTAPPGFVTDDTSLTVIPTQDTGTVALTNCVDQSNGTAPPVGPFCSSPAISVTNATISFSGVTQQSNAGFGSTATLSSMFSLSEMITIAFSAGTLEVQTRQVLSSVPEPASIVFLGTTTLVLISFFRKRLASRS